MSKKSYPGYSPTYKNVLKTGGYSRTCFVLEFQSLGALSKGQVALIDEQVSALVNKLKQSLLTVEKAEVVTPDRFDPILLDGLRLTRK
jgi:hypothetical protein